MDKLSTFEVSSEGSVSAPGLITDHAGQQHDLKTVLRVIGSVQRCSKCQADVQHYAGQCSACRS
jgi:hypothetical protein